MDESLPYTTRHRAPAGSWLESTEGSSPLEIQEERHDSIGSPSVPDEEEARKVCRLPGSVKPE